ncbi:hypothetical protein CXG81DRAFT_17190 [Caulochytrium protostelioides]|uniref:PUM-HD domain-containing protein n=1 Tax=Caulochytrium protostelioides TaxID=1555241 RepID=A0A4P9XCP5_9FUNG|nr:hypothetical protein CXG81DRAFT_17190 [Caulochytrium protostelioides]|eukprot:RKP03234.1 hypothetical protein CXG81DRAFT_17190 [Caulochytrium protostelioides]
MSHPASSFLRMPLDRHDQVAEPANPQVHDRASASQATRLPPLPPLGPTLPAPAMNVNRRMNIGTDLHMNHRSLAMGRRDDAMHAYAAAPWAAEAWTPAPRLPDATLSAADDPAPHGEASHAATPNPFLATPPPPSSMGRVRSTDAMAAWPPRPPPMLHAAAPSPARSDAAPFAFDLWQACGPDRADESRAARRGPSALSPPRQAMPPPHHALPPTPTMHRIRKIDGSLPASMSRQPTAPSPSQKPPGAAARQTAPMAPSGTQDGSAASCCSPSAYGDAGGTAPPPRTPAPGHQGISWLPTPPHAATPPASGGPATPYAFGGPPSAQPPPPPQGSAPAGSDDRSVLLPTPCHTPPRLRSAAAAAAGSGPPPPPALALPAPLTATPAPVARPVLPLGHSVPPTAAAPPPAPAALTPSTPRDRASPAHAAPVPATPPSRSIAAASRATPGTARRSPPRAAALPPSAAHRLASPCRGRALPRPRHEGAARPAGHPPPPPPTSLPTTASAAAAVATASLTPAHPHTHHSHHPQAHPHGALGPFTIPPAKHQILPWARDATGCRALQRWMGLGEPQFTAADLRMIVGMLTATRGALTRLMMDRYGNYFCQKVLARAPPRLRLRLVAALAPAPAPAPASTGERTAVSGAPGPPTPSSASPASTNRGVRRGSGGGGRAGRGAPVEHHASTTGETDVPPTLGDVCCCPHGTRAVQHLVGLLAAPCDPVDEAGGGRLTDLAADDSEDGRRLSSGSGSGSGASSSRSSVVSQTPALRHAAGGRDDRGPWRAETLAHSKARALFCRLLVPHVGRAVRDAHGTHVIRAVVGAFPPPPLQHLTPIKMARFASALRESGAVGSVDVRGGGGDPPNRKALRMVGGDTEFVFAAIAADVVRVACHRQGCCVVQRCLDAPASLGAVVAKTRPGGGRLGEPPSGGPPSPPPQDPVRNALAQLRLRDALVRAIIAVSAQIAGDPYGNYVVQYVIDHPTLPHVLAEIDARPPGSAAAYGSQRRAAALTRAQMLTRAQVLDGIATELLRPEAPGGFRALCEGKCSSNVVERLLRRCAESVRPPTDAPDAPSPCGDADARMTLVRLVEDGLLAIPSAGSMASSASSPSPSPSSSASSMHSAGIRSGARSAASGAVSSGLAALATHDYGNYVVQTALDVTVLASGMGEMDPPQHAQDAPIRDALERAGRALVTRLIEGGVPLAGSPFTTMPGPLMGPLPGTMAMTMAMAAPSPSASQTSSPNTLHHFVLPGGLGGLGGLALHPAATCGGHLGGPRRRSSSSMTASTTASIAASVSATALSSPYGFPTSHAHTPSERPLLTGLEKPPALLSLGAAEALSCRHVSAKLAAATHVLAQRDRDRARTCLPYVALPMPVSLPVTMGMAMTLPAVPMTLPPPSHLGYGGTGHLGLSGSAGLAMGGHGSLCFISPPPEYGAHEGCGQAAATGITPFGTGQRHSEYDYAGHAMGETSSGYRSLVSGESLVSSDLLSHVASEEGSPESDDSGNEPTMPLLDFLDDD